MKLLFWGVGNPGPDWNGDNRPGDNLYTCSLAALDADTGRLRWRFQFTPHDEHDWDATEIPVLIEASQTNLFYVAVREMGSYYYKGEAHYKPGTFFAGGGERALDGDEAWGAVRALKSSTGKMEWEFRLKSHLGPAFSRLRAAWSSVDLVKGTSMRSMLSPENRYGIFRPAAASNPAPSAF